MEMKWKANFQHCQREFVGWGWGEAATARRALGRTSRPTPSEEQEFPPVVKKQLVLFAAQMMSPRRLPTFRAGSVRGPASYGPLSSRQMLSLHYCLKEAVSCNNLVEYLCKFELFFYFFCTGSPLRSCTLEGRANISYRWMAGGTAFIPFFFPLLKWNQDNKRFVEAGENFCVSSLNFATLSVIKCSRAG